MFDYRRYALERIAQAGTQWLPFADAASAEVPLSRLLRLSLFQVTVGMAMVLLAGTLNRVMIVELSVPATLVAVMLALPVIFAPLRALVGFKSDTHRSALGLRRVPWIFKGTMYQFGGFAIMPFALLVLSGFGESADAPLFVSYGAAGLAFLLVGAGVHIVQTVGLALATDLVPQEDQPKVVGLMYVMLLLGMIGAALVYGWLLDPYSPAVLIQVIQGSAVVTVVLNGIALWKQEPRDRRRAMAQPLHDSFGDAWGSFMRNPGALRLLAVIGLGTAGFGMADVLMEPYGGQVLGMTVAETTRLTAVLAGGTLIGFAHASRWLGRGGRPTRVVLAGAGIGLPAFGVIILAAFAGGVGLFTAAVLAAGYGAGLFGHGTLTATMRAAPREQIGLALGAWGAVQATCAGIAIAVGGVVRDVIVGLPGAGATEGGAQVPYLAVFTIELVLLALAVAVALPLRRKDLDRTGRSANSGNMAQEAAPPVSAGAWTMPQSGHGG